MNRRHPTRWRGLSVLAVSALAVAACSSNGTSSSSSTTAGGGNAPTTAKSAGKGSAGKGEVQPGIAGAPAAASGLSGPITVGLDFKPENDGFAFENYGKAPERPNLTADDVARFFGDSVCASKADGKCILSPPAQQWMEATNEGMNGGHCEGMAALALLIKKGQAKASDFGADATSALKIDGNERLSREIAYWFATQFLDPTAPAEVKDKKPSEVVAMLRDSFKPESTESYTLGIYKTIDGKKREGHAITPFGLVDGADGKVEIAIYDNNFPGQTRAVVVDTANEKWTYSTATNPSEPVGLYEGDASTFSLTITPTTARLKPQACPFCGAGGAGGDGRGSTKGAAVSGGDGAAATDEYGYLFLNDTAEEAQVDLKVTNPDGSPLEGLKEVDTKGADGSLAQDDAPGPILIPLGKPFKVTIDGSKVTAEAVTNVTYIGGGADFYIDEIKVDPGQVDEALFDPTKGEITYTTQKNEAPTIGAGFQAEGADYAFAIGGVDLPDGGSVTMTLDQANGTFAIKNQADKPGTYALGMIRIDESGEQTFGDDGFELPSKASVTMGYKEWTGKSDKLKLTVDLGDGSAPQTTEVQSEK